MTLEVARGTVVSCAPNQPAFEAWQAARLAARKVERIAEGNNRFYGTYHEVSILPDTLQDEQLRALTILHAFQVGR